MDLSNLPFDEHEVEERLYSVLTRGRWSTLRQRSARALRPLGFGLMRYPGVERFGMVHREGNLVLKVPFDLGAASSSAAEVGAWERVKLKHRSRRWFLPVRFIGSRELFTVAPRLRQNAKLYRKHYQRIRRATTRFGIFDAHHNNVLFDAEEHPVFIDLGYSSFAGATGGWSMPKTFEDYWN